MSPPNTISAAPSPSNGLLSLRTLAELRAALASTREAIGLPMVQTLLQHARQLEPQPWPARLAIVHTFTSELLQPWLELASALQGLDVAVYHAPYGLALDEARPGSALLAHRPEVTWLLLQQTDLHPALGQPLAALSATERQALRAECLAQLREWVTRFRTQGTGHLLVSLLPAPAAPALGLYETNAEASATRWWRELEAEAAAWLRAEVPASSVLSLDDLMLEIGRRRFFDLRYWHASRYPFTPEAAFELARRVAAYLTVLKTPRAKVIVLDADNTLWGGVIGEDGIDGIALGPDHPGSAFVAFQRRLLDFQQRGFVLAMCSKNNPGDVDEVLRRHPHQLLREEHFAAMRVNWQPKPDNLIALAEELNLGLDSFVFVDDSDHECAAVRERLPQVEVIQVPKRPTDVPGCLDHLARLEVLAVTAEDRAKTAMYAQERQRQSILHDAAGEGGEAFLQRLEMRMRIGLQPVSHLSRLAQLTQKTNQFNLTTRRYDEQQMRAFIEEGERTLVADFSLADRFGDSGIVGLAIVKIGADAQAEIDTFLMSCRVIGRCAGEAFLEAVLRALAERGVRRVGAAYLPTTKNQLVQGFLPAQGFVEQADGSWQRNLEARPAVPESAFPIAIEWHEPVAA
jgi:FkbH-like protein